MARSELRSLTGIRGLAAIGVVLYHLGEAIQARFGIVTLSIFGGGYVAVDLFFVLSGFIISYNYRQLFSAGISLAAYAGFIGKRVARLYRLYFVLTLAYYVKNTARSGDPSASQPTVGDWAANLTLTNAWGFETVRILGASWSISTEFFAYFLFPALTLALARRRAAPILLAVLSVLALLAVAASGQGVSGYLDVSQEGSSLPLLRCLAGFSLGLLTHHVVRHRIGKSLPRADGLLVLAAAAGIAALAFGWDVLAVMVAFPLIIAVLATGSRLGDRLLGHRPAHLLGLWSYAIYLVHPLCINPALRAAERLENGLAVPLTASAPVLMIVPLLVVSALLHRFVELPGRRGLSRAFAAVGTRRPLSCDRERHVPDDDRSRSVIAPLPREDPPYR